MIGKYCFNTKKRISLSQLVSYIFLFFTMTFIAILKSAQKEMEATVLCVSHDPRLIEQGDVRLNIETYTQAQ